MSDRTESPRVAFLFTGQGSQRPGMAKGIYARHDVARRTLDECEAIFRALRGESLLDVMLNDGPEASRIHQTELAQPALYALEVAVGRVWIDAGIRPMAVLGHSIGELAAACLSDACSLQDGLAIASERGRLMQQLPLNGGMLAVRTDLATVEAALAPFPDLDVAAVNGPKAVVVSGDATAIAGLEAALSADGVASQRLTVSHAFHSRLMTPMLDAFRAFAARTTFGAPRVPFVSTLLARALGDGDALDTEYWAEHVRKPVRFMDAIRELAPLGADVWLEVGPDATLLRAAKKTVKSGYAGIASLSPEGDDDEPLAEAAEALRDAGVTFTLDRDDARVEPLQSATALEETRA